MKLNWYNAEPSDGLNSYSSYDSVTLFTNRFKAALLLWFTISVIICLCMFVLVKLLFWIAVWPMFGEICPFGFVLVEFWLWCRCFKFALLSLWTEGVSNGTWYQFLTIACFLFTDMQSRLGWGSLVPKRSDVRLCMLYKLMYALVKVPLPLYFQQIASRTVPQSFHLFANS